MLRAPSWSRGSLSQRPYLTEQGGGKKSSSGSYPAWVSAEVGACELLGRDGESLLESRALLAVLREAPVAISLIALPERRYKFVNAAHIAMIGCDLTGLTVEDAYPEMPERDRSPCRPM